LGWIWAFAYLAPNPISEVKDYVITLTWSRDKEGTMGLPAFPPSRSPLSVTLFFSRFALRPRSSSRDPLLPCESCRPDDMLSLLRPRLVLLERVLDWVVVSCLLSLSPPLSPCNCSNKYEEARLASGHWVSTHKDNKFTQLESLTECS
jgi:hypothetical protein